jgi:hypothetical protein
MKDGKEAELRAEMFGIGGDCQQSFGGGAEQDVIDRCFVVKGNSGDLLRQGEDDMEVRDGQEF